MYRYYDAFRVWQEVVERFAKDLRFVLRRGLLKTSRYLLIQRVLSIYVSV